MQRMRETESTSLNNGKKTPPARWLEHFPDFVKRLWFQLAVTYALLAFCAMTLLSSLLYAMNDYEDFREAITLENVERRVVAERLTVAQAIRDTDNAGWRDKARANLRKELENIEYTSNDSVYRITNSSRPEVYIQMTDADGRLLLSDPVAFPAEVASLFAAQKLRPVAKGNAVWLAENGPIWIDMPVTEGDGVVIGHLHVMFIAEFDIWMQGRSILNFLLGAWSSLILLCIPIGIVCGFVAARYVKNQLRKMNEVTESWRQGRFEARIALPSDDVLTRHSQHLNDMARDLELYMGLKQNLAVSDERNRVARELHDTVKQKLFALGLQLATTKTMPAVMEVAREHIMEAETITREAQHDLMEIITQLRPTQAGAIPLHDRISMIADDFRRRFDADIKVACTDPIQPDAHVEHHVLRIIQEALMNAVRHGTARRIIITGKDRGDRTVLTIADNGSGFDLGRKTGGFGIISMRDRALGLPRGTFEIESAAGIGTLVTLSWRHTA